LAPNKLQKKKKKSIQLAAQKTTTHTAETNTVGISIPSLTGIFPPKHTSFAIDTNLKIKTNTTKPTIKNPKKSNPNHSFINP
jgi:hypothetical protein